MRQNRPHHEQMNFRRAVYLSIGLTLSLQLFCPLIFADDAEDVTKLREVQRQTTAQSIKAIENLSKPGEQISGFYEDIKKLKFSKESFWHLLSKYRKAIRLVFAEGILFVVLLFALDWRGQETDSRWQRIYNRALLLVIYLGLGLGFLPWLFYQDRFVNFLEMLFGAASK